VFHSGATATSTQRTFPIVRNPKTVAAGGAIARCLLARRLNVAAPARSATSTATASTHFGTPLPRKMGEGSSRWRRRKIVGRDCRAWARRSSFANRRGGRWSARYTRDRPAANHGASSADSGGDHGIPVESPSDGLRTACATYPRRHRRPSAATPPLIMAMAAGTSRGGPNAFFFLQPRRAGEGAAGALGSIRNRSASGVKNQPIVLRRKDGPGGAGAGKAPSRVYLGGGGRLCGLTRTSSAGPRHRQREDSTPPPTDSLKIAKLAEGVEGHAGQGTDQSREQG